MSTYLRPTSLKEAHEARAHHPDYLVLAGGTDVMVGAKDRPAPPGIIDLFGLPELSNIRQHESGTLHIGACVTYQMLLQSELIEQYAPLLARAAAEIGAAQIQNRGTIGGNIGTSSPVGDTLPVLIALNANILVASETNTRLIPYDNFITGYRQTALQPDELIVAIELPKQSPDTIYFWRKVGTRKAQSISKVMVAASACVTNNIVTFASIGAGAVNDRPMRLRESEDAIVGQTLGSETAQRAKAAAQNEIAPIDDLRSTSEYRRLVTGNLVARFVTMLGERVESRCYDKA